MQKPLTDITCRYLKGVGPKLSEKLAKIGVETAQDILFHLPLRYQDRTRLRSIRSVRPGEAVLIEGVIEQVDVIRRRRLSMTCRLRDQSGEMVLRFFHFTASQRQSLARGRRLRCFGEVRFGSHGFEMTHPEYDFISEGQPLALDDTLTPVYPTTQGVSQHLWRKLTDQVLVLLSDTQTLPELLSDDVLSENQFPNLVDAIRYVHRPPADADVAKLLEGIHPFQQRLAFEELLAHQLSLLELRKKAQQHDARALVKKNHLIEKFLRCLPFELTAAQQRVFSEISADCEKPVPMLRLLQGDVGSGKTVIAALSALQAIENGFQVAMMAPTEILAEQHLRSFSQWFEMIGEGGANLKIAWLTSQIKGKKREAVLGSIKAGEAKIAIGTHALFQKEVEFKNLALVIVDEQHRFGVHQRLALKNKGLHDDCHAHQLIMTATPIPRTLAMCAYADLDQSIIDELPPGRKPVQTVVIDNRRRAEVLARIKDICQTGRQVYWVCTLIEESEVLQCQAAEKTAEDLKQFLPEVKVALVHGRMKAKEKEAVMTAFKAHEYDLLVATTVIEVGVDIPNASLMVIENPERLGLSQLHQLRGRVGRGEYESHCVLLYQSPLSKNARERLDIMRQTNDGFVVAQKDLELRGPGEVLGTRQKGDIQMRLADILRDKDLIPKVQAAAKNIIAKHPERAKAIVDRWLGDVKHYGEV